MLKVLPGLNKKLMLKSKADLQEPALQLQISMKTIL